MRTDNHRTYGTDDQKHCNGKPDGAVVFLSRPRRFGKSLLTTTLDSYFKGLKELFEGLKIMDLKTEWEQYPVIHVDLSVAKAETTVEGLRDTLMWLLNPICEEYGKNEMENSPGKLFSGLIHRAYEKTGKQVAVIIDEYDAPVFGHLRHHRNRTHLLHGRGHPPNGGSLS